MKPSRFFFLIAGFLLFIFAASSGSPLRAEEPASPQTEIERVRAERERIEAERERLAQEAELVREKKLLEEEKKALSQMQRAEKNAKAEKAAQDARERLKRMERFDVSSAGVARDVDNFVFGAGVSDSGARFTLADEKVTWFAKFNKGITSKGAGLSRPVYTAIWYSPAGSVHSTKGFKAALGNNFLLRTDLEIDPSNPDVFVGTWKVEVRKKDELFDVQEFEILEA